jgi:hypothetical protein
MSKPIAAINLKVTPTKKLYTYGAIYVSSLFSGPLSGIYMICHNHFVLGEKLRGYLSLFIGFFYSTTVIIAICYYQKNNPASHGGHGIPLLILLLIIIYDEIFLSDKIKIALQSDAVKYSKWSIFFVTVLSLILICLLFGLLITLIIPDFYN